MKRILSLFLCLCWAVSLLSGCRMESGEAYVPTGDALALETDEEESYVKTDETQEISLVYYPNQSMNPIFSTDYTNRVIFPLLYQSLFVVDRNNEVIPQLCQSYTVSEDLRTYEFTLNPRATFSDGSQVTAQDVAHCYWAVSESAYYGGRFQQVSGLYPTEAGTLVMTLKQACDDLPRLLDIPIVKGSEVWADYPIGSGPYILSGTETNRYLSRRSNWWCHSDDLLITAGRIPLLAAQNPTEVRDFFEFGDAGVVCTDPGSDRYVEYRCDYELWDCETGTFVYLGFNLQSALFQHVNIRQAVVKGINRSVLVDEYYQSFALEAELPASPNFPYYSKALAQNYAYDREKFLSDMSAAGVMGRSVRLLVNSDDSLRVKVAQEIGRMLNECGLIVTVEAVGSGEYVNRLSTGNFDLYLGQTKLSPNMDLSGFFSEGGSLNYGGLTNLNVYSQCLKALENEGNYYSLHQTIMENALICPLLFRSHAVYAARGLLTQLQPARDNLFCYSIA